MHLKLPKPLHGWREFAGEVGVVLLGVLLALAAQQLMSDWQWRDEVHHADQRMKSEISFDVDLAYERYAIDPCLRPRRVELRDQLLKSDAVWPGSRASFANDLFKSGFPSVYRTPHRPWLQASWLTALNGGLIGHFHSDRAQQFAALFDAVEILRQAQSEEDEAGETLGDLAFPGPISPAERRANLKVLARLDALDALILFDSKVLIDDARKAGIGPNRQHLKELLDQQRSYRGPCVRDPGKIS